jgi:membrane protease YdiL (CAAX protease family)
MNTNSYSASLVLGLASFSLALVIAGVQLYRRNQARGEADAPQDDMQFEKSTDHEEPIPAQDLPENREAHEKIYTNTPQLNLLLQYFLLVFVLAVPFWLFGGGKLPLPINLPVGALVTFVPVTAAAILYYRQSGFTGVKQLLKKAVDYQKIKNKNWYLPTLFLMPLIYVLSYAVMRLAGLPLPDPIQIPLLIVPIFFLMFFIGDAGEELGWSGYAIDPIQDRWGAFKASLILGVVWAIWHVIPFVQTGNPPMWIVWKSLSTVALRILIVWIYNNTGKSVFAVILFHDMVNVSEFLFPNYGSHLDPFVTGLITLLTAAIVIFGWGAKTLARYRYVSVSR